MVPTTFLLAVLTAPVVLGQICQDTAPGACALLAHSKSDLCSDVYIAQTTCPKYCGLCPLNCYSCDTPTLDHGNCTEISNCSTGEICSSRELKSTVDGRHEYTYGCLSKQVCDGSGLNIAFGKRDVSSRSLSISCCDSDLCNHPAALTCEPDLIFMVDDGGNVSKSEFHMAMNFVSGILKSAEISDSASKVSVLTYASGIHTVYNWGNPQELDKIIQAINSTSKTSSSGRLANTYSELALAKLRTHFLNNNAADRSDHPDVIVMVTNGDDIGYVTYLNNLFKNHEEAELLRRDGVRMVLVKVGNSHKFIVEKHVDAVISSGTYSTLNSQLSNAIGAICK